MFKFLSYSMLFTFEYAILTRRRSTQRELARLQAQQTELNTFLVQCMEDVKAEKLALEASGARTKKKGDTGLSPEDRNKVLVKLVSKERVLELLKDTMGVQKADQAATQRNAEGSQNGDVEDVDTFGGEEQVTRALPPRGTSPSPAPSPSSAPASPFSITAPSLKANFMH